MSEGDVTSDAWDVGRTQKSDLYCNPNNGRLKGWERVAVCSSPEVARDIADRLNQQELERARTIAYRANMQLAKERELNVAMAKLLGKMHDELYRMAHGFLGRRELAESAAALLALWPKEGS